MIGYVILAAIITLLSVVSMMAPRDSRLQGIALGAAGCAVAILFLAFITTALGRAAA